MAQNKPIGRWGKLVSSAAESSMASGGSSLLTLDLPPAPLAELINVMDLYQSLFGTTPDVRRYRIVCILPALCCSISNFPIPVVCHLSVTAKGTCSNCLPHTHRNSFLTLMTRLVSTRKFKKSSSPPHRKYRENVL